MRFLKEAALILVGGTLAGVGVARVTARHIRERNAPIEEPVNPFSPRARRRAAQAIAEDLKGVYDTTTSPGEGDEG